MVIRRAKPLAIMVVALVLLVLAVRSARADVRGRPDLTKDPGQPVSIFSRAAEAIDQVALTFDAGWEWKNTAALLDVLSRRSVKATFFLRGRWATDHPELVHSLSDGGHQIGGHSLTHRDLTTLSWEEVQAEIGNGDRAITAITGGVVDLFRPPYGSYSPEILRLLAGRGYAAMVMWDVDSLDWTGVAREELVSRVLSLVRPGSVVLMHIGGQNTVEALPAILDGLAARGLRPVTVAELMGGGTNTPLDHSERLRCAVHQRTARLTTFTDSRHLFWGEVAD